MRSTNSKSTWSQSETSSQSRTTEHMNLPTVLYCTHSLCRVVATGITRVPCLLGVHAQLFDAAVNIFMCVLVYIYICTPCVCLALKRLVGQFPWNWNYRQYKLPHRNWELNSGLLQKQPSLHPICMCLEGTIHLDWPHQCKGDLVLRLQDWATMSSFQFDILSRLRRV